MSYDKRKNEIVKRNIIISISVIVLGISVISLKENMIFKLTKEFENLTTKESIILYGGVVEDCKTGEYNNTFKMQIDKVIVEDTIISFKKPKKVILNISINKNKIINIFPGDYINVSGEYFENSSYNNFGIYNSDIQNKRKNIYGRVKADRVEVIEKEKNKIISIRFKLIENITNKILKNIKEYPGLFLGILIGKKDYIDENIEEEFRKSGISHVLAVSGAHVACIISIVVFILNKVSEHYKLKKFILGIIILLFFFIVGNSPSILRTIIMSILVIISKLIYRKSNVYNNLGLSGIITLIINPYYITDLGFLLSYLATFGILLFDKDLENLLNRPKDKNLYQKLKTYILNTSILSISANLCIIPIIAYNSNAICLSFIITNLFISPFVFILEFLGILFIFLPNIFILNKIIELTLIAIINIAKMCAEFSFSEITVITPNIFEIVVYYIILFIIYCKLKHKIKRSLYKNIYKLISVCIIISLLINIIYEFFFIKQNLKIYFLDVGQGDSTLIVTEAGKKILIDGGGNESYDIGENILKPYLLKKRISKIDYIIISHLDYDHCGGIISLLEYIDTEYIILPIQYEIYNNLKLLVNKLNEVNSRAKIIYLKANDILSFDSNTYIQILWPFEKQVVFDNSINNNALVFKLKYNGMSMIFTGDIEKEAEEIIVEKYKNTNILNSDFLKVAHHGSDSSSIDELIKLINPKLALIGVGRNNKYGHPSESVLDRLEKNNCKVYRTDLNGEVDIVINKAKNIEIITYLK